MSIDEGKPSGQKQLHRKLRDMVTSITNHVTDIHKSRSHDHHGHNDHDESEEHGVSIITLSGNNTGATLQGELEDHHDHPRKNHGIRYGGSDGEEPEGMSTYVNSNFQAANNSIMMGGSYTTNDPGVHLDVSDIFEPRGGHGKPEKKGWKGKEKEKESYQSDHHHHQEHDETSH